MERRVITVRGIVQGVGFRPFVHGLATRLRLGGSVRNTTPGVVIEIEGAPTRLDEFQRALLANPPPLASIDTIETMIVALRGEEAFTIDVSRDAARTTDPVRITPDVATCGACLDELLDPANRRFHYPFITCATCGPRLTIVTGAPYDRERTTMAPFAMCARCREEYDDPANRRFHAETIGCHACGPRLRLADADGRAHDGDPIAVLAESLKAGQIAAIKGIGGYHLACDATNADAVGRLRARKHRDEKPFAVMFADLDAVRSACDVSSAAAGLLRSPARPIVLLPRVPAGAHDAVPAGAVAPRNPTIGAMLPATPLHHLLLRAAGRPLVMTSGNRSQEPIAFDDDDARDRLRGIADLFLSHDRAIRVRCDDGVARLAGDTPLPIRRSRGEAPRPIPIAPEAAAPILAAGGHLKNTFALAHGRDAVVSHHIGDLDDRSAFEAYVRDIALYEALFAIAPAVVAHDLHPDYHSTRYALDRAGRDGLRAIAVQHHHAHVASCMAEHGIDGPVIGVAFDGSGDGGDGTVWGGEFLVGDALHVERRGHLRQVALPGGEQAVREPWRMALAHLRDAGADPGFVGGRHPQAARVIERMLERRINSPQTSSVGRLFDAVAAIAGLRDRVSFEGQAAMELEHLASATAFDEAYVFEVDRQESLILLDPRPVIRAAAADARASVDPGRIARRFHAGLADGVASVCRELRARTGVDKVVLTGGVFLNALLTSDCAGRLTTNGFGVYRHERVPPNDGGLSLGQLAVAAARLAADRSA